GDKSAVIHVWKDLYWESVVKNVTKAGYRVLFSAAWYLNYISYGDDWRYHYRIDPRDFGDSKDDAKLVIGGEAAMWGEYVDDTNLFSRSWPRGSAVAERLWTHGSPNTTDFIPRVEELRCRMLRMAHDERQDSSKVTRLIPLTTTRATSCIDKRNVGIG
ncbi:unnamed protein product, partial [Schistosoma margrebowiei]